MVIHPRDKVEMSNDRPGQLEVQSWTEACCRSARSSVTSRAAGYTESFKFEIFATDHSRAALKALLPEAKAWFETCTTR